jgi:hypothetical protein
MFGAAVARAATALTRALLRTLKKSSSASYTSATAARRLFDDCTTRLELRNSEAFHRIPAARIAVSLLRLDEVDCQARNETADDEFC